MNDLAISEVFLPFKLFRLLRLLTVPSLGDRCWHALSQQVLSRGNGDGTREKDAQFLLSLAAKILVNYASSFRRRVIQPVESFPLRLLKFANKSSEVLKSLADELLDSHSSTLDHSALKFREAFFCEWTETTLASRCPCAFFWCQCIFCFAYRFNEC